MDTFCQDLGSMDKIKSVFVAPNPFTLNKNWRFNFIKKTPNVVYLDGIDVAFEKTLWDKINTIAKDSVAGELPPPHERLRYAFKFDPKVDYTDLKTIVEGPHDYTLTIKLNNL